MRKLSHAEQHQRLPTVRILLERDRANCAAADLSSPTPLLPFAMHLDERVVEIQFRSHDPDPDITDSSGEPGLFSAAHVERRGYWTIVILSPCLQIAASPPNHPSGLDLFLSDP